MCPQHPCHLFVFLHRFKEKVVCGHVVILFFSFVSVLSQRLDYGLVILSRFDIIVCASGYWPGCSLMLECRANSSSVPSDLPPSCLALSVTLSTISSRISYCSSKNSCSREKRGPITFQWKFLVFV